MDRKNFETGNNIFLCITVTILIFTFSCASLKDDQKTQYTNDTLKTQYTNDTLKVQYMSELLLNSQKLLEEKDFEGAIQENQKVLSLIEKGPPGDRALFNIAMIYAHHDNPDRDYGKALELFRQIIQEYPGSQLLEQSKTLERIITRSIQLQLITQEKTAALDQLIRSKDAIARSNSERPRLA